MKLLQYALLAALLVVVAIVAASVIGEAITDELDVVGSAVQGAGR